MKLEPQFFIKSNPLSDEEDGDDGGDLHMLSSVCPVDSETFHWEITHF